MAGQKRATRKPGYYDAVRWIALNDEPGERELKAIRSLLSVALVADLFGVSEETVATDVVRCRAYQDNPSDGVPAQFRIPAEG